MMIREVFGWFDFHNKGVGRWEKTLTYVTLVYTKSKRWKYIDLIYKRFSLPVYAPKCDTHVMIINQRCFVVVVCFTPNFLADRLCKIYSQ